MDRNDRIRGGVIGMLVGDALGVPYEFHVPTAIPGETEIEMDPPPGFRRAHPGTPPGTWSDDGAMALCLLASLLHCGRLDLDDLGHRFVNWGLHGYMAVDGRVFDIGNQTGTSLTRMEQGAPAASAGGVDEGSNGNGSLMRVLPLALWHGGSDAQLVDDAHAQSKVTHAHPRSQVCCALYCLWVRQVLEGGSPAEGWEAATATLRRLYAAMPEHARELEDKVLAPFQARGSGYVVDCLHTARVSVLGAQDYTSAVKRAIRFGLDTDTSACVTGGLAGVWLGASAIPSRWVEALRGREILDPLLDRLI